jgi:hypothetical protein
MIDISLPTNSETAGEGRGEKKRLWLGVM